MDIDAVTYCDLSLATNQTIVQSNLAKGCTPSKVLHPVKDLDPIIHGSMDSHESAPKRHLDRFSHFCTSHPWTQHIDRQTHSPCRTTSVAIVHIYALHAGDADEKRTGI